MSGRLVIVVAALLAALGVALGAYAAHGLAERIALLGYGNELDLRLGWFETGVRYHMLHSLAAILAALIATQIHGRSAIGFAAIAFFLGILLFSGSLYTMTFAPDSWKRLGAVTPVGGLSFIVGWIAIAMATWGQPKSHGPSNPQQAQS